MPWKQYTSWYASIADMRRLTLSIKLDFSGGLVCSAFPKALRATFESHELSLLTIQSTPKSSF